MHKDTPTRRRYMDKIQKLSWQLAHELEEMLVNPDPRIAVADHLRDSLLFALQEIDLEIDEDNAEVPYGFYVSGNFYPM